MLLLLHVLMLSLLSGGSAKVVQNFEIECGQFFANGTSPTRFNDPQYRQICQTLNNVFYYATFYDTDKKIPVYSAYKFEGLMNCTRTNAWYIEPQLDDNNAPPDMKLEKDVTIQGLGGYQALNDNYTKSKYDKGHLAPVFQAQSQGCSDATFTLTNAAPQDPSFNRGQWKKLERNIAKNLSDQCLPKKYSVHIVTGVVPGTKNISDIVNVTVPSHFWTAYCCLDNNNKCKISGGFIGVNENFTPDYISVNDLETELTKLYNCTSFNLFDRSTEPRPKKQSESEYNENFKKKAPMSYCLKEKLYPMFSLVFLLFLTK
ncbi:endonuclease domain-containing 1 protein-like [Carassius gibelio]|uniref:endonuclease domain-containing 1 protein-like n=1 Tax=Carassius gibelio TaxID=101364 RepID=UPI002278CE9E|nr:endonuclease domain-containing 1 protein-like [Carassius gibelio]